MASREVEFVMWASSFDLGMDPPSRFYGNEDRNMTDKELTQNFEHIVSYVLARKNILDLVGNLDKLLPDGDAKFQVLDQLNKMVKTTRNALFKE